MKVIINHNTCTYAFSTVTRQNVFCEKILLDHDSEIVWSVLLFDCI